MAKAIEEGLPKMRIEEAAARTQARLDSGAQKLVGVNTYRPAEEDQLDVLRVDNASVYKQQLAKLERLREERDADEVERTLHALTRSAEDGHVHGSLDGNLLALAVDAARAKATVGEISEALEKVYGRHRAVKTAARRPWPAQTSRRGCRRPDSVPAGRTRRCSCRWPRSRARRGRRRSRHRGDVR